MQFLSFLPSQVDAQNWIQSFGTLGCLVYLGWGTLSVVVTPLNFSFLGLAGGFIYGTGWAFVLNWICKIIGTSISFFLAQKLGRRVLNRMVSKSFLKKFDYLIEDERTMLLYTVLCFIPFTPSDTLAYLVGMSKVRYRSFLPISIVANSGTAFGLAYLGSGGAFKDPLFLIGLGLALLGSLSYIHIRQKNHTLHA